MRYLYYGLFLYVFSSPLYATPKTTDCILEVDGTRFIDGPCTFDQFDKGSFQIKHDPYFAYVLRDSRSARGSWNADPQSSHAHVNLGMLRRDGACWLNDHARVCAWKNAEERPAFYAYRPSPDIEKLDRSILSNATTIKRPRPISELTDQFNRKDCWVVQGNSGGQSPEYRRKELIALLNAEPGDWIGWVPGGALSEKSQVLSDSDVLSPPLFKVDENCRNNTYCIREEQKSYDFIKSIWNNLSIPTKKVCASNSMNLPSYNPYAYTVMSKCISVRYQLEDDLIERNFTP